MGISYDPVRYESITVGDTVVGLTASLRAGLTPNSQCFLTLENGPIRYRMEGEDPSVSEGHKMSDGDSLILEGRWAINNFKAIRIGTDNGILRATFLQG